ncbi:hypothetical protein ETD83_21635 [Actinomadura soli]|uniref:Uncharacterized protein n=1 Tax=Actinomadura soli TaxID=2508997 RepID=A0A5C4J9A0_9ACTN|nr:hypothetical protein [Actinomadura soli]TMQ96173.1 hypothetical protein ETD83_21635 [Actinomadura soli]
MKTRRVAITTVAGAVLAASFIGAPAAEAKTIFTQQWRTTAKERASHDFVPKRAKIKIGGHCKSGGKARYFYTQLKRTKGSKKIFSSYSYPCNGRNHTDNRRVSVGKGTSYYLKWFGQKKDGKNGYSSPGQRVYAAS